MAGECTCGVQGFDHSATCPACTDYEPRVTVVSIDDWQILYVNGKKRMEQHSLDLRDIAEAVGWPLEYRALDGTEFDREVSESGVTPELLEDVPTK